MKRGQSSSQIVLFPTPESERDNSVHKGMSEVIVPGKQTRVIIPETAEIVISGSFRKDLGALTREFEELRDLGFSILSPMITRAVSEEDGLVFMEGEESAPPETIERRHLEAIQRSAFVWLHAPEGYVVPSAALEVGFARARGIPVYSRAVPTERV